MTRRAASAQPQRDVCPREHCWIPKYRRKVLRYVYERDGRRCGVCGAETRIDAAHVEHIVPKIFAYVDINKAGKAVQGTRYKSLLHRLDNLQASHTYCNKNKGNTADVTRWRHATMPRSPWRWQRTVPSSKCHRSPSRATSRQRSALHYFSAN